MKKHNSKPIGNSGMFFYVVSLTAILLTCSCTHSQSKLLSDQLRAFPGAEGAGKFTKGGRGGDVYHVTNLKDSGAGSLREGIESIKGPRTIVFDVGGTIRLKDKLEIINKSYLTIAGQTAPGKGITLADHSLQIKESDHIIVRYLRVRLGDENKPAGSGPDCITVDYNDHIILDHLSLSWGIDGNGDFRGLKHATVQWVIFSEALHDSLHGKGPHAMCTSFRDSAGPATLHHNIYASSRARHPSMGGGSDVLEFCNNLDYNWEKGHNISGDKLNLINNYYKAGPSMHAGFCPIQFKSGKKPPTSQGYLSGNHFEGLPEKYNEDNYTAMDYKASGLGFDHDHNYQDITRENFEVSKRFDAGKYKLTDIESAKDAYESCLKYSGCSLVRDTVDERFIRTIIDNTGRIIDSQNDVGGWDTYARVSRQKGFDSDRDGMDDAWEIARGLDPNDPADRNGITDPSKPYTNLERYLSFLVGNFDPDASSINAANGGVSVEKQKMFKQLVRSSGWQEAFSDPCTNDWQDKWFLDGQKAKVSNSEKGMDFFAGPVYKQDTSHAVMWTKESFEGDLKIEYEYTRLDKAVRCVNILYIQATGFGKEPFVEDIFKWHEIRDAKPSMKMYYNHMNTYHISYAAFTGLDDDYIRLRRYMPDPGKGLKGTDVAPDDYKRTGLFATGVPHKITVIKKGNHVFMRIKNAQRTYLTHWENTKFPPIHKGRIGLRHMFTRGSRYKDFKVYLSVPSKK